MDKLRAMLRHALTEKFERLAIRPGQSPALLRGGHETPWSGGGVYDSQGLGEVILALLPGMRQGPETPAFQRGTLSIPQVGTLSLIASLAPTPSLWLYLPAAAPGLADHDFTSWSRSGAHPPLPAATGAPPPITPDHPPSPQLGGFIPTVLAAPKTVTAPPVATAAAVAQAPAAEQRLVPLDHRPATDLMDSGSEMATMDADDLDLNAMLNVTHRSQPASGRPLNTHHSKRNADRTAEPQAREPESTATIIFGADADGSSSASSGQNAIDSYLTAMIARRASDLHLTALEPACMRIDGEISRVGEAPVTAETMAELILPMMPPRNRAEFAKIHDTDFAYELLGVGRFRVNVFRDKNGVGAVLRHIPSKILTAEQLNLPAAITKFCHLSKGLVVVTGPTGSGKSTTLAAMIDLINKTRHDHILTVEDPIEFVHPQQHCLVNQREVHKHTGSFARALKAALREDPDIILIGEMRDLETVAIAIETAETGHLVFGTLHTNTAVSTIDRIIDQFPTDRQAQIRTMLASSLKGVVAQTLLKKKGGGRVAAHEILVSSDAVAAMIREGKNHMIANHMQSQKADGNLLLTESLFKLVKDGVIEADDAMRKAVDKGSMADVLRRATIKFDPTLAPATGKTGGTPAAKAS